MSPDELIDSLAAHRSPEVLRLGNLVRDLVRRAVPAAHEVVYHRALCYGMTEKRSELKVYISFHTAHVNLGFYHGAGLPDPKGLLAGDGPEMRHIKVQSTADVEAAAFQKLISAALTR